tara:strand:+ start:542 stop:1954 length:1413 start_codon:yes stop_codon:yes gene_type:complete
MQWLFVLLSSSVLWTGFSSERPNLLLFLADDMTYTDLGCYGNPDVKTPSIDQLAEEGVLFTRCYNSAPTCSPLRQSLYTGLYPIRSGAHPNHSRVYVGVKSIPHYLEPLGYRVAIVGKRHEAPAEAFPFEYLGGSHGDSGKTPDGEDLPLAAAREFMARDVDQPWCLVVASNQPHTAWNRGDASAYPPNDLTVPPYLVDTPETRDGLSRYYAEITYMDGQVKTVMDMLEGLGQAEDTAFLWLSEQGSQLPFGKWTCYDTGIHAAAVMRWPGVVESGVVTDALVSYVDVVPTWVELAGGDPEPFELDGESFVEVLRGDAVAHHEAVFATNTTRGIYNGSEAFATRSATDGEWLYIRNLHPEERFQNSITEKDGIYRSWKSVETRFARERVNAYQQRAAEELYDLETDPWCLDNLFGQVGDRGLSAKLNAWMEQQGDEGDVTERDAENRQPDYKPWSKNGGYDLGQQGKAAE